jgi:hypothetical protein
MEDAQTGRRSIRVGGTMTARLLAVLLALVAMVWAGPAISAAADDTYVSPAAVTVDPAVIGPGGRSVITFSAGFFGPNESVDVDVSGARARDARVLTRTGRSLLVSSADGSLTAVFVAPRRGSGRYTVTFAASRDYTAVITVTPGRSAAGGAGSLTHPDGELWVPDTHVGAPDGQGAPGPTAAPHPSPHVEETPTPPDREGSVEIPGRPPEVPAWPGLAELPWAIVLLGAITLIAGTVTATLLIAARRRR